GGAVTDSECSTQIAMLHGRIVAQTILTKRAVRVPEIATIPRVIHTTPAVASVGLTDDDCLRRDLQINQSFVPLSQVVRANISDTSTGFVKLIADKKGLLLGATIVAPAAGEMIHEVALALNQNLTAHDLAAMPHAFMTWSEAIRAAAAKLLR
ncbi:NAD(P)/FAD-dependent oxidoreductase, partial [Candidatus Saccharibacteria bacterium]|nr:NAD(P)/FAD-dependent oxidoreductase [Candidatus Saccharibacteria bacterium]